MSTTSKLTALVLVGLIATTAGCAGIGTNDAAPTSDGLASPDEGAMGTSTDGTATAGTTGQTETAVQATETTTSQDGGHDHSGTDDGTSHENGSAAATGTMAVVVDGTRVDLGSAVESSSSFRADGNQSDNWHANESLTLANALSQAGVDASAERLSYNGSTYYELQGGTELVYRVNGESVRPSEYRLQDGDEVWVLALTNDTEASTPGDYIPPERLHVHGTIDFEVNGESLDFSRDKWQAASHNSHFHFEGGHEDPWHAHSWSVTLAYALSTLEDIEVDEEGITYEGTTYDYGSEVTVTVNGEEVDPTDYNLKDGDSVTIVIEEE